MGMAAGLSKSRRRKCPARSQDAKAGGRANVPSRYAQIPVFPVLFRPLTRRGHSTSISEVSANADGDEGLTEMASAMQSSASRLMTRCEMSPPLARPGMGLSARPLRCCLFIESPTLPFLLLSSYSRHGISCWRTRNTELYQ